MTITEKKQSYFFTLLDKPENIYIDFDAEKYDKLKEEYKNLSNKINKFRTAKKINQIKSELNKIKVELEKIESIIAVGLIKGCIPMENYSRLGFNSNDLRTILIKYKKEIDDPYNVYHYEEYTKTVFQVINGEYIALPYMPLCVRKEIVKNKTLLMNK